MLVKRSTAIGGAGHRDRRWLLTGLLVCGDCGHKLWGDPRRKGRKPGQAEVMTNYYTCSGRRAHGADICGTPSTLRCEAFEAWILGKLQKIVLTDAEEVDAAIERFIEAAGRQNHHATDAERTARELKQVNDTVTALTMNIDPANLSMLNDRLTQLRLRKERLEQELHVASQPSTNHDGRAMRKWARDTLAGLQAALAGIRNDLARDAVAAYVDHIKVWPSRKCGEMVLNPGARALWKHNDRPFGRSLSTKVGATVRSLNLCCNHFWTCS